MTKVLNLFNLQNRSSICKFDVDRNKKAPTKFGRSFLFFIFFSFWGYGLLFKHIPEMRKEIA